MPHKCLNCGYANPPPQKPIADPNAPVVPKEATCKTCNEVYTCSSQAHAKDSKHKLIKSLLQKLQVLPANKLSLVQIVAEVKEKPVKKKKCPISIL